MQCCTELQQAIRNTSGTLARLACSKSYKCTATAQMGHSTAYSMLFTRGTRPSSMGALALGVSPVDLSGRVLIDCELLLPDKLRVRSWAAWPGLRCTPGILALLPRLPALLFTSHSMPLTWLTCDGSPLQATSLTWLNSTIDVASLESCTAPAAPWWPLPRWRCHRAECMPHSRGSWRSSLEVRALQSRPA